jgi:CubicO group peptidase (beta-lactamase class C family)
MSEARALLIEIARHHSLGGAAVAIVRKGQPPIFEWIGLADGGVRRPIDASTVFRIASISKTMTAIGLMQLRDDGRFGLDDPVNKYLATFTVEPPQGAPEVTFRHLLTHTAGIGELPRVTDIVRPASWGMGKPGTAGADLSALYRGTLRPDSPAGAKWAYANHGFAVLGQLVEDMAGRPFADHMQDRVFRPLGLVSTEYTRTARTASHLAAGHHWMFSRFRPVKDYDLAVLGPGSVLSSLTDMATYAEWLLHGGAGGRGDVLAVETLAEMMSPQYSVHPGMPGMGLAFWLDRFGEHRVAGHDGNVPGFASSLLAAPDDGVGVVALTNTSTFNGAHHLAAALLRSLLDVADPATQLPRPDVAEDPALWSDLVGYYAPKPGFLTNVRSWQLLGGEVQVLVRDRRLVLRALSPLRSLRRGLVLHAADNSDPLRFVTEAEGFVVPVAFAKNEPGCIDRVIIGPPANIVFYRRSTLRSTRVRGGLVAVAASAAAITRWRRQRRPHSY